MYKRPIFFNAKNTQALNRWFSIKGLSHVGGADHPLV